MSNIYIIIICNNKLYRNIENTNPLRNQTNELGIHHLGIKMSTLSHISWLCDVIPYSHIIYKNQCITTEYLLINCMGTYHQQLKNSQGMFFFSFFYFHFAHKKI